VAVTLKYWFFTNCIGLLTEFSIPQDVNCRCKGYMWKRVNNWCVFV